MRRRDPAGLSRRLVSARARVLLLAVVLLGTVLPVAAAAAASAQPFPPGIGIRLVDPSTGDDPRARSYIVAEVAPGAAIVRRVAVSNGTDEAMRVAVYPAAADVADGWRVGEGRARNELTAWTTVTPQTVVLQPWTETVVTARVEIPADAVAGERYAAVIAEAPKREVEGWTVIDRVGIRMYVAVTGDRPPVADLTISDLTGARDDDGTPIVAIAVANVGELALDLSGTVQLSNAPGRLSAGPFDVVPRTVGPGRDARLVAVLDPELPLGPWRVDATLRSGAMTWDAEGVVTFPASPGVGGASVLPADGDGAMGSLLITLGVFAAITAAWRLLAARRRRGEDDAETVGASGERGGDA